jgi:hypothetical protein
VTLSQRDAVIPCALGSLCGSHLAVRLGPDAEGRLREASRILDPDHDRLLALLMREGSPPEVWRWTHPAHVAAHLDRLAPRLGRRRAFWLWLFAGWKRLGLLP